MGFQELRNRPAHVDPADDHVDKTMLQQGTPPTGNRPASRWWMVPSMTRRPAKPIKTFGSAMMISPSEAKEAVTPPVVGVGQDGDV